MNNNYWLHRITGGDNAATVSYPLFWGNGKEGYISIGWSDFSKEEVLKAIYSKGVSALDSLTEKAGWGRPKNRWNLWRFIREMKAGDVVVVPASGEFSVCVIADDKVYTNESMDKSLLVENGKPLTYKDGYLYNSEGHQVDLGFYRKVILKEIHIPRGTYAQQGLYSRMKIWQTNAAIGDLQGEIDEAVHAFHAHKPINLKGELEDALSSKIKETVKTLVHDDEFEDLVEWYLKTLGARTERPAKNESPTERGDADVVAYFDKLDVVVLVQVKKHEGETNEWAIEQIMGYKANHDYDSALALMWVISNCDEYSSKAEELAEEAHVRLIDGDDFSRMILDAGLDNMPL